MWWIWVLPSTPDDSVRWSCPPAPPPPPAAAERPLGVSKAGESPGPPALRLRTSTAGLLLELEPPPGTDWVLPNDPVLLTWQHTFGLQRKDAAVDTGGAKPACNCVHMGMAQPV